MILFWIFVVVVIIKMVRSGNGCCGMDHGGHGDAGKKSDAENILEQRYAKGEITKEQFEEMRKVINNK